MTGALGLKNLISSFTYAIDIWGCFLLIVITIILAVKPDKNKSDKILLVLYCQMLLFLCCYVFMELSNDRITSASYTIYRICMFLYFFSEPLMIISVLELLRSGVVISKKPTIQKVLFYIGVYLMIAASFILMYSIGNDLYYTIDNKYNFSFSPFFITHYLLCFISLFIAIFLALYDRKKQQEYIFFSGFTYALMGLVGGILDLVLGVLGFVNITLTLGFVINFVNFEKHEVQIKTENRHEIERMKTKLMMSQIQPHFLYNCLTSIIYISDKDTAATKNALLTFSKYLRMNLESIDKNSSIPFEQEFDHTMAYLSLEKLRFGDDLRITLDIKDKDFYIPVLCMQPLVENAVKHGIHKSESGSGNITIISKKAEGYHRITVTDDGVGFDTAILENLGDNHVGIRNVRRRLSEDAGAQLIINSSPGKGTKCLILIPEEGYCNENNGN